MEQIKFIAFCKDIINDEIDNLTEKSVYISDLSFVMTEYMNTNGTFTFSRDKAIEIINEWWDDAADYLEFEEFNIGKITSNPFRNPEGFLVTMVIYGTDMILQRCEIVEKLWDKQKITLTQELVDIIKSQVLEIDDNTKLF